jgi:GNAT superfamily N-acetyltransferase
MEAIDLHIRRYEDRDAEAVWDLHNRALHEIDAHGGNGPWDEDLHRIDEVYIRSGGEFVVGENNGRVVAMGALLPTGPGQGEIKRMRVEPSLQRQGLGRAILSALLEAARRRSLRRLHLETTAGQVAARGLYESSGFVMAGSRNEGNFEVLSYRLELR